MGEAEHQFEVVARAYYKIKAMGYKPKTALFPIGREQLSLDLTTMNRAALRAKKFVARCGQPESVDDKRWFFPTAKEIKEQAA